MFTIVRQYKQLPGPRALTQYRKRPRSELVDEFALTVIPSTHILCSAHVCNGKDRDHVLREIELNRQGLGLEDLASGLTDEHMRWHIYNPGFQVESQFVDLYAYLERKLKVKLRFLVTYSVAQRRFNRQQRTMCVIISLDDNYDSITLNKLKALLINAFADASSGLYDHLRLTVVFRNIRIIYNDLDVGEVPTMRMLSTSMAPTTRFIVYS